MTKAQNRKENSKPDMTKILVDVGFRIREFRKLKNLTLQQIADTTGLSPSMLSLVERGKTSPSIGTLMMISSALDIQMGELISRTNTAPINIVSSANTQPIFETANGVLRRIVLDDPARDIEIAINSYDPGTSSADAPVHHEGFEYGIILEGELCMEVDGTNYTLHVGDCISYDSQKPHRLSNQSDRLVRALWVNLGHK